MFYFAYGANMNRSAMKMRCPASHLQGKACLRDYQFVYDKSATEPNAVFANIVAKRGSEVWGALFRITENCLIWLDKYEDYPEDFKRFTREVVIERNHGLQKAIIYYHEPRQIGKPAKDYQKLILEGAKECGAPLTYIAENLARV